MKFSSGEKFRLNYGSIQYTSFQTLLGHNEDGAVIANTTSYIIDAEVTPDDSNETERFIAFCYAGQLCSTAFGYSESAGKVFSSNALFPKTLDTRYVGTCKAMAVFL